MRTMMILIAVVLSVYLISGCSDGPADRYIGEWSNDNLDYGTLIISKDNQCTLKNFQGFNAETSWELGDTNGSFIRIGDGKKISFTAAPGLQDRGLLIVTTSRKKDLYMYKK